MKRAVPEALTLTLSRQNEARNWFSPLARGGANYQVQSVLGGMRLSYLRSSLPSGCGARHVLLLYAHTRYRRGRFFGLSSL